MCICVHEGGEGEGEVGCMRVTEAEAGLEL